MQVLRSNNQRGSLLVPSLSLDFRNGIMPQGLTFSRTTQGTRINALGVLETVAVNMPRFDYDPVTLACKGLLIEESRTNSLINSSDFSNNGWTRQNITVSANLAGPFGTNNAQKITGNVVSNTRLGFFQNQLLAAGQTYTYTVYLKAGERNTATIFFNTTNSTPTYRGSSVLINLTTGTTSDASVVTLTAVGNGWYRACCTATISGTGNQSIDIYLTLGGPNGSSGDGVSGLYVWGAQLEVGAFATSYIPTTTAAVTRAADVCTMSVNSWYNTTEGAISVEYNPSFVGSYRQLVQLDDGGTSNRISLAMSSGPARLDVTAGGTNSINAHFVLPSAIVNTINKAATTWKLNDTPSIVAKGGSVNQSSSVVTTVPQVTLLSLGTRGIKDVFLCGCIRQLTYYPRRLPNSTLQLLTQ